MGSGVGKSHARFPSFTLFPPRVSLSIVSPKAVVLCFPLWLRINAFSRGSFSTPQSLDDSQFSVSSTSRGQKVTSEGLSPHPIQSLGAKDGANWELIRDQGILVHPSSPDWVYLQLTSFIGRIFSILHME